MAPYCLRITSLLALALAVTAAMFWQIHTYNTVADTARQGEIDVYVSLYPNQSIPTGIRSRLEANLRQLRGVSGRDAASGGQQGAPELPSALVTLHETLRRLPTDLRLRILDLEFTPDGFTLELQTRRGSDVDAITAALRKQQGFDVQMLRLEALADQGVAFTLVGTRRTRTDAGDGPADDVGEKGAMP